MITEWHRYCDTRSCIETRSVGDQVEIRDTERPDSTLLVPAKAWEARDAALRAEGYRQAIAALRDHERFTDWDQRDLQVGRGWLSPLWEDARAHLSRYLEAEVRNNEGESR